MTNYRVNLGFTGFSDGDLDEFTSNVITSMTNNAAFPNPPVPIAPTTPGSNSGLTGLQSDFQAAVTAAMQGGKQAMATKNEARIALEDALRTDATYVQSLASHDLPMLLSSGFQTNNTNRAQTPLETPSITAIANDMTTQLTVRLQPVANAHAYEVRASANGNGNTWLPAVVSTQGRRVTVPNLTPGTTYTLQSRAVGGSTGYSAWSDPVSHMAM